VSACAGRALVLESHIALGFGHGSGSGGGGVEVLGTARQGPRGNKERRRWGESPRAEETGSDGSQAVGQGARRTKDDGRAEDGRTAGGARRGGEEEEEERMEEADGGMVLLRQLGCACCII
jgi:hypothetical protein